MITAKNKQQLAAASEFVDKWTGHGYEKGETQLFWLGLLRALGADKPEEVIRFELPVKIRNTKTKATMTYSIVPEKEADFKAGKLSINSPIGQGLLGKKVGDMAEIVVPAGKIIFEVLEITRQ